MGHAARSAELERARGLAAAAPRPAAELAGAVPSAWLEEFARERIRQMSAVCNMLTQALNPPRILGVDGGAPRAPQISPAMLLQNQLVIMQGLMAVTDMLLIYTTGKPELRPVVPPSETPDA